MNNGIDWDYFWYADQIGVSDEIREDLKMSIVQPKGSLFFNRADGTNLYLKENAPNTINHEIEARFSIVEMIGRRNTNVDDGGESGIDQRAAVSQSSITFDKIDRESYDVNVYYYLFSDITKFQKMNVKI